MRRSATVRSRRAHGQRCRRDVWRRPYDRAAGAEAAMTDYLSWEIDLPDQVERDGDARFRTFKNEAKKGDSPL